WDCDLHSYRSQPEPTRRPRRWLPAAASPRFLVSTVLACLAWGLVTPAVEAQVGEDRGIQACSAATSANPVHLRFTFDEPASETDLKIRTSKEKSFSVVLNSSCLFDREKVKLEVSIEPSSQDDKDLPRELADSAVVFYRDDGVTIVLPVPRGQLRGAYDGAMVVAASGLPSIRVPIRSTVK